jgi:chromosome partitioning protein
VKVIAIINQKGGVGKTTTAINLSACLAEKGIPTLLIDLDPQANATSGLGATCEPRQSIYPALIGEKTAREMVQATSYANLFLIPSEIDLAGCEIELARLDNPLTRVKEVIEPLRHDMAYEYILIDCPPSLGVLMTNALAAAEGLVVPLQCEFYALEGIKKIFDLVIRMSPVNPHLKILGILMTMYDTRTRLSQQVVEDVHQHLPDKVFQTIIPRSVRFGEAPGFGQPITVYDPHGISANAYRDFTDEFLLRCKNHVHV